MRKKFIAGILTALLLTALFSFGAAAEPYAEINIAASGVSKINATDFDTVYGLTTDSPDGGRDIRPETDVGTETGGNQFDFEGNVGWMDQIEWLDWTINVAADGFYRFSAAIASDSGNGGIDLYLDGEQIGSSPQGKEGNGWQEYVMYTIADIQVSAGTHVLRMVSWSGGGINIAGFDVEPLNEFGFPPVWENPNYRITRTGTTTIKATDFDPDDYGKEGDDGNQHVREGHAVRTEGNDSEWGSNIGWIGAGDWVQYTVTVANDGMYAFVAQLASDSGDRAPVTIKVNGNSVTAGAPTDSTGWQDYHAMPADGDLALTAGENVIIVEFGGGVNFAALEVSRTGDIEGAADETPDEAPASDEPGDSEASEDGETADAGDDESGNAQTGDSGSDGEEESNMILWIILGVVGVVVIVVIVVIATKKKK